MPIRLDDVTDHGRPGNSGASAGLFGPRSEQPTEAEILKKEAFRLLKPRCVPIMGIFTLSPTNYQRDLKLFDDLLTTLNSIPHEAYVPSIINYAIFPLTHILQRNNPIGSEPNSHGRIPDRILERLFECLTFLVERWKRISTGIDLNMWEQLWTLSALLLGGPLQTNDPKGDRTGKRVAQDKGKGRALSEETQLAVLGLMTALLDPISEDVHSLDQDDDDDYNILSPSIRIHPTPAVLERLYASKMLPPIMFHTISTLLDLVVPSITPLEIQIRALDVLDVLVKTYLKGKVEMLASVLPGLTSSLIKVFSSGSGGGKQVKEKVALGSMNLLQDTLVATLGDETLVDKGVLKRKMTNLDELVQEYGPNDAEAEIEISTDMAEASRTSSKLPRAFPDLTPQYLDFTSAQLVISFKAFLPALQDHSSPLVRKRLAELCNGLLVGCHRSLVALHGVLLGVLLQLVMDEHDSVADQALKELHCLIESDDTGDAIRNKLKGVADQTLAGFPSAVMSQTEAKARAGTRIITALCTLSIKRGSQGLRVFDDLLGTKAGSQRWIWPLLTCLELGRAKEVVMSQSGYAARAWEMAKLGSTYEYLKIEGSRKTDQGTDTTTGEGSTSETIQRVSFPELSLKHVDSPTLLDTISGMFIALGKASGSRALDTVEHLITIARAQRNSPNVPKAATALWIAEQVLRGLYESPEGDSKSLRKEARSIVRMLVTFDEEDDAEPTGSSAEPEDEVVSDELVAVERKEGLNALTNLLKRDHRGNKTSENENRSLHLKMHRELVTALSLSMMSACARILGSAFRPMLLDTLYILLSHLGSPVAFIRGYAEIAIMHIAYDIGYASPQNMIVDNVDYVINIVSQRMTFNRLSPLAPMVLISMIRLVGEPIVPLVQDIVDDIFDCLDSYHGYELLASTMLAVLDTLMRAMTDEVEVTAWTPTVSTSKRLRPGPDPKADFNAFQEWYNGRALKASEAVDSFLEPTPQNAWNRNGEENGEDETEDPDDPPANARDEPEIPATRAQEVCRRIMEKDIFFMTHSSPFVRARVLSLFTNGIPVLITGNREGDLLPLVNTAWPYILNRLRDSEPYVVTEAAVLVEALAKWVGDFMSRRILEDAWPILKELLASQKRLDERSALARRNLGGAASTFTVSHRLHMAIINMLAHVVQEVPVADSVIWEVIMLFRPFLDANVHQDQQDAAVRLYQKIAKRDEDAVWVALRGTIGEIYDTSGRLAYLRQPGLNIHDNVQRILPAS